MHCTLQKIRNLLALTLILGFASTPSAHAGLLLEPYLGYHVGKSKVTGQSDSIDKGVSFGGRVGIEKLGFMAGLDYMTGSWSDDGNPSATAVPNDLGLFVGYDFPILLRVYATYNFIDQLKSTVTTASSSANGYLGSGTFDGGSSLKLGVGITTLPFLSLNFEYITGTYTKFKGNSLTSNVQNDMYGVTISLPFNL